MQTDESEIFSIQQDEPFRFDCGPHVPCFNACCRDLSQYLSPYDVFRLKMHLGISSSAFLENHALRHDGPRSMLPVITLKPAPGPDRKCPFVTSEGCTVYPHRPASCRMYPVMRMAKRDRITGAVREEHLLIREPHCRGFEEDRGLTAKRWTRDQGLLPYNAANDRFLEVLAVKNRITPGVLTRDLADRLYTVLYDPDRLLLDGKAASRYADMTERYPDDPAAAYVETACEYATRLLESADGRAETSEGVAWT